LVGVHMVLACILIAAMTAVLLKVRAPVSDDRPLDGAEGAATARQASARRR
jgi:cytochrome c oxidase assembly protein subunit 15